MSETFEIDNVKCTKETDKAILVEGPDLPDKQLWVPKSVVEEDSDVFEPGNEGSLVVKEWWARKNDLA